MSAIPTGPLGNLDPNLYWWGALNPVNWTAGLGIFTGIMLSPSGAIQFIDDIWGPSGSFPTADATIGSAGGVRVQRLLTNRTRNPIMNCVFKLDQTANTLLYIGFWDSDIATPSGTDPLNAKNGVALAINGGNFRVAYNDGTGATVFADIPSADGNGVTNADTNIHTLQISANETNGQFIIELDKFSVLRAQSRLVVNTDIPASTIPLTGAAIIETQAAAVKQFVLYRWEMFC